MKVVKAQNVVNEVASLDKKASLAKTLRHRILSMEMAPGAVVDEVALSEEFGMSRPPIRELIRQMAAEGYMELEANRAPRVSSMTHETLRSFFLAAPLIFVATTKLAAMHATPAELEALKAIQQRFKSAVDENDVDGRVYYNDQFHFQIGKMAHNPYFLPTLRRLQIDHARLGKTFYQVSNDSQMQAELEEAVRHHDEIIEAVEQRDAEAAEQIVRQHLDLSRRHMTTYAIPAGLDVKFDM